MIQVNSYWLAHDTVTSWVCEGKLWQLVDVNRMESVCLYQDCSYTKNLSYTERPRLSIKTTHLANVGCISTRNSLAL